MLLNRQRNLLTIVATLAFATTLLINGLAAREVRLKTAQISMAEETMRAVSNFRYLAMEVALYGEARAGKQWALRHAGVQKALAAHRYSEPAQKLLLARAQENLTVLDRLFKRLEAGAGAAAPGSPARQHGPIVSALFLTTQDMLDDGFDLMRLNRLGLEAAQRRATFSAIASLSMLVLLIGLASLILKRQVLRPVAALQRLTEQVIKGQLDVRLNLLAPNEIGLLGRTFDSMTMQLQQSHQAMQTKSDELAAAQVALQTVVEQLQNVLDAASDFAIVETDLNGTIKLFSAGAERMLGYSAAEVVNLRHPGLFHVEQELAQRAAVLSERFGRPVRPVEVFSAVACEGGSETLEWTYVRKDGSTLPVNLTVTAVRNAQGRLTGFLGIASDIRAERDSRQVLADARDLAQQASLAKSQFLANMSHEIRTPMNAVLGMLELLQHTALSPLQADYARKSESAASSLLGLLNDILDFSQVEANKLLLESSTFRLDGLMRDLSVILSSLLGNKEVELIFAIDPAIPPLLRGDATRLRQVLINLASNAIKFTERGEVTVTLALKNTTTEGDEVEFIVHDTGIGIAADKLGSIFDGFTQAEASTTRRFGGTGLGLTISQRLVGLMKGRLTVESRQGVGSRFAFSVLFERPAEGELRAEADHACPQTPMRLLIVDDNQFSRNSLMSMAASFGWNAAAAAGGEEALALLDQESAPPFDVLLIDWRMPRMDGWELARRIRARPAATPIIVMVTAHGRGALAERLQSERTLLNGFLTKPVTPAMLREVVCGAETGRSIETVAAAQVISGLRLAGLRLLVVDDNPMNQQIARELLLHEGASVDVAGGGVAALEMAAAASYDAILMDIQMPDMDGYACTRALRATPANRATPVIAMTANVMSSDRDACLAAGMNDHLGKPIAIDSMVNAILLHGRRPGPAPARPALPAAAGTGAIDLAPALERLGGNAELYVALAGTYADEAALFMPALKGALPDQQGAANILHTFKSAAGIVGATALQNYASDLEASLRAGAAVDGARVLADLEQLVAASIGDLAGVVRALAACRPAA